MSSHFAFSANHAPADCSLSLSWTVIELFLGLHLLILTYIFVMLALPGGSGPLYRRWLPFKDSSCCTFAQEVPCFQLCPTEGILTKVPFSSSWRVWVGRFVAFSCRVSPAEPSGSVCGCWVMWCMVMSTVAALVDVQSSRLSVSQSWELSYREAFRHQQMSYCLRDRRNSRRIKISEINFWWKQD